MSANTRLTSSRRPGAGSDAPSGNGCHILFLLQTQLHTVEVVYQALYLECVSRYCRYLAVPRPGVCNCKFLTQCTVQVRICSGTSPIRYPVPSSDDCYSDQVIRCFLPQVSVKHAPYTSLDIRLLVFQSTRRKVWSKTTQELRDQACHARQAIAVGQSSFYLLRQHSDRGLSCYAGSLLHCLMCEAMTSYCAALHTGPVWLFGDWRNGGALITHRVAQ